MPQNKKKASSVAASAPERLGDLEMERYPNKLWTVTKGGELVMAMAQPPADTDESYGVYWDVSKCGDNGGPPQNKVRAV